MRDHIDNDVAWTGRTMKAPWFAEHMREELVLHGWDITGDDDAAQAQLAQPWMTTHSVLAVGRPLLVKGATQLRPGERIEARLRVEGADDVLVRADTDSSTIELAAPAGPATLETDAAQGFCCCGAVGPPIRRALSAGSDPRIWDGCGPFFPDTELYSRAECDSSFTLGTEGDSSVTLGGNYSLAASSVPCLIARLASSSAATAAPPMMCGSIPPRRSSSSRSRTGS